MNKSKTSKKHQVYRSVITAVVREFELQPFVEYEFSGRRTFFPFGYVERPKGEGRTLVNVYVDTSPNVFRRISTALASIPGWEFSEEPAQVVGCPCRKGTCPGVRIYRGRRAFIKAAHGFEDSHPIEVKVSTERAEEGGSA